MGPGYGLPTPGMVEAVTLMARQEGILLDPVYSGKAMAGLIDLVRKGHFRKGQNVVFLHTGGSVGLFGYTEAFTALKNGWRCARGIRWAHKASMNQESAT